MFGGKPVTVQMAGGCSKTLTLVPPQQGIAQVGKIVRIPATSAVTSAGTTEQPKLIVVQRSKQPTATIGKSPQLNNHTSLTGLNVSAASTSFDGPATTDAALAALAAEAGLIDPEPEKETPTEKETITAETAEISETPMQEENNGETERTNKQSENAASGTIAVTDVTRVADNSTEVPAVGLFGGSTVHQKLGLKGGSKIRLGLFGGSPIGPFSYRGGLFGGSKDSPELASSETSEATENNIEEGTLNGTKQKEDSETVSKMETDNEDTSENPVETTDSGITTTTSNQEETKEEFGDALSALASAALDHSKEFKPETPQESKTPVSADDKDAWFTVGFIKGNSYDVHSYCFCDDDTSQYTSDSLPDLSNLQRISLEPGTAYKFRVAAINSVGRGDWSEVSDEVIIIIYITNSWIFFKCCKNCYMSVYIKVE